MKLNICKREKRGYQNKLKITAGFSLESLGHWRQGQQKRNLEVELVFWGEMEREF